MSNFELIDDYLANRLSEQDSEAFRKQLGNDPALKSEVEFQQQIVDGIRQARATELKTMLKNVPVGSGAGVTLDFSIMRMAAGIAAVGVVGAALYFYMKPGDIPSLDHAAADLGKKSEQVTPENKATQNDVKQPESNDNSTVAPTHKEEKKKEEKPTETVKPAEKPDLQVTDPSDELASDNKENTKTEHPANNKPEVSPSHVAVEMDSSNKKYDFHYQFLGQKLRLYGSFDKSLYEVLEINGENHAVFLFFKDSFYLLDESEDKITKLLPIKDGALLKKLKEYRSR